MPFQDCLDATKHFLQHAADFNVDPKRVAVAGISVYILCQFVAQILSICNWKMSQVFGNYCDFLPITGDSAGGNIASAVSLKLRDIKMDLQPKLQILIYPVTQALDFNLPSYIINQNDPFLQKEKMVAMWLMYAKGKFKT